MRNGIERVARAHGAIVVVMIALLAASARRAAAAPNLLNNPDFDSNTSGWQGPWVPFDAARVSRARGSVKTRREMWPSGRSVQPDLEAILHEGCRRFEVPRHSRGPPPRKNGAGVIPPPRPGPPLHRRVELPLDHRHLGGATDSLHDPDPAAR